MSVELKIKAKHLALEPAIIRKEENKLREQLAYNKQLYQVYYVEDHSVTSEIYNKWYSLQHHRKTVVRNAARATHLARAYIAGMPYSKVEKKCDASVLRAYILPEVFRMVAKYGDKKLVKRWSYEHKMLRYNEAEERELWDAIKKWLET